MTCKIERPSPRILFDNIKAMFSTNVLGGAEEDLTGALMHVFARDREIRVHLYGKEVKAGRKVGHVTALGRDLDDVRRRAHHAAGYLMGDPDA